MGGGGVRTDGRAGVGEAGVRGSRGAGMEHQRWGSIRVAGSDEVAGEHGVRG